MITALVSAVRFFWVATAGHRLRPWRSEYLRWRMETYTGKPAGSLQLMDFLQLAWRERGQMLRFFAWTGEIHDIANGEKP